MGISNYFIQTAALLTLMSLRIIFLDIYGQWLNKVGEENLFNYRFTFTHSLPNPKPCQDFSGYGIFTLQLTGYKIFWGTIEGTRDMRHLGRISKGVERLHIHWRGNSCSAEEIQWSLLFRSPVSSKRPPLLSEQFSKIPNASR